MAEDKRMNLKIKITLETKRLLRLRRSGTAKIWCQECSAETDFILEKEIRDLIEKLETGLHLHKISAPDGTILICLESLSKLNPE